MMFCVALLHSMERFRLKMGMVGSSVALLAARVSRLRAASSPSSVEELHSYGSALSPRCW